MRTDFNTFPFRTVEIDSDSDSVEEFEDAHADDDIFTETVNHNRLKLLSMLEKHLIKFCIFWTISIRVLFVFRQLRTRLRVGP